MGLPIRSTISRVNEPSPCTRQKSGEYDSGPFAQQAIKIRVGQPKYSKDCSIPQPFHSHIVSRQANKKNTDGLVALGRLLRVGKLVPWVGRYGLVALGRSLWVGCAWSLGLSLFRRSGSVAVSCSTWMNLEEPREDLRVRSEFLPSAWHSAHS